MNAEGSQTRGHTRGLILVLGCPRSGTNLLAMRLMQEFHVVFPFENHVIPLFWRWRFLYGDLGRHRNRTTLVRDMRLFLRVRDLHVAAQTPRSGAGRLDRIRAVSLSRVLENTEDVAAAASDYPGIVRALFERFRREESAVAVGDKSSYYYPESITTLQNAVQGGKVIHVIRDGRDVCASWRRSWFGPGDVTEAARLWSKHVSSYRRWGASQPERYREVRYEQLLDDEERVLDELAEFLELERQPVPSQYATKLSEALGQFAEHHLIGQPTQRENRGGWRERLSRSEADAVQLVAETMLRELDYPVEPRPPGARAAFQVLARAAARLRAPFTGNWLRRRLKSILPLFFVLGGRTFTRNRLERREEADSVSCETRAAART